MFHHKVGSDREADWVLSDLNHENVLKVGKFRTIPREACGMVFPSRVNFPTYYGI